MPPSISWPMRSSTGISKPALRIGSSGRHRTYLLCWQAKDPVVRDQVTVASFQEVRLYLGSDLSPISDSHVVIVSDNAVSTANFRIARDSGVISQVRA